MNCDCISDVMPHQMYNFEYGYPHFNALLQSQLKLEHCKLDKVARHPTKFDVINDV